MSKARYPAPPADQAAIARIGAAVRARLETDPTVQKVPGDRAEIYAVGNFLSTDECNRLIEMMVNSEMDSLRNRSVARPSGFY